MADYVHAEAYHRLLELFNKTDDQNRELWKQYHNLRLKVMKYCPALLDESSIENGQTGLNLDSKT